MRSISMIVAASLAAAPALSSEVDRTSIVRTVAIADDDFSDLAPLARDIGSARVVMLGEQTHGDGSAFLAKGRVVRFLHEIMGFDLLVFESGFTDLATAQARIDRGESPSRALKDSVFPVWSAADQFAPLLSYLERDHAGRRPLRFAGIDAQFTGKTVEALPAEWRAAASTLPLGNGRDAFERLASLMETYSKVRLAGLKEVKLAEIEQDVALARAAVDRSNVPTKPLLSQQLKSTGSFFAFALRMAEGTPEVFNLRDAQMADNLRFILSAHPGKKVIVWGATSHFIRSRDVLIDPPAKEMKSVGSLVAPALGRDLYVLATSGAGGAIGSWAKKDRTDLPAAMEGSIEAGLKGKGAYRFVPRSALGGEPTLAVLGYQPVAGRWDKAIDGLFFIDEMAPTTYPATLEP